MRKTALLIVLFAVFLMPALQAFAQERPSIPDLLENDSDGRFTTLLAAIDAAGLRGFLEGDGPYTLLAPTNDAFDALGLSMDDLTANPAMLKQIVLQHVIPGRYLFRDLTSGPTLRTSLIGQSAMFDLTSGVFTVNGANIGDVDNLASNGVVQVVDSVIQPPALARQIMLDAVKALQSPPTTAPTTVPTIEPTEMATPEATVVAGVAVERPDLIALLQDDPDERFTTLLSVIDAAGLTGFLQGDGPYTLLAPTDDAFDALEVSLDDLMAEPGLLKQIVLQHILPGRYQFRDLTSGPTLRTSLIGQNAMFDLTKGVFTVNGANISDPDNLASNGVMIAIDSVILPPNAAAALMPMPEATVEATAEAGVASSAEGTAEAPTTTMSAAVERPNIIEVLQDDGRFTTLLAGLDAADLTETLKGDGPFTLLAPTDDAFNEALTSMGMSVDDLTANPTILADILRYHVIPGRYLFRNLTSGPTLDTALEGSSVTFDLTAGVFTVNGANIGDVDNIASNGVVQVVDSVILPPAIQAMMAAMSATEEPTEMPTTAPTATATQAPTAAPAAEPTVAGVAAERPNLVEVLQNDPDERFTTLVAALQAAGLTNDLSSGGPYTLLAPTNDAFAATLEMLGMSPEQVMANPSLLAQILQYHVIPGRYQFRNLTGGPTLPTLLQGESVTFDLTAGVFTVEGSNISDPDNLASNGVVHAIDAVMIPPAVQAMLTAASATPEATEVPTAEPTSEATAEITAAHWRIAEFSSDGDGVDVYIDGDASDTTDLSFASVSDWMGVEAGTYEIGIAPNGDDPTTTVSVDVSEGDWVTIAITGSSGAGTITATPLYETTDPLAEGAARLGVFNGVEGSPSYDVVVDGRALVITLGYPGTLGGNDGFYSLDLTAGTYNVQFVLSRQQGTVVIDLPAVSLDAGTNTLIAAIGSSTAPGVKIVTTDAP